MTLGDIIKKYREDHEMSMDNFARASGISKAYIGFLEKNKHPKTGKTIAPSVSIIKQAADGMHMDFDILFSMLDDDYPILLDNSIGPIAGVDTKINENMYRRISKYLEALSGKSLEVAEAYEKADERTRAIVEVALGIGGKNGV